MRHDLLEEFSLFFLEIHLPSRSADFPKSSQVRTMFDRLADFSEIRSNKRCQEPSSFQVSEFRVPESPSEIDLIVKAQAGDAGAFSTLVDRYWDPLHRWLCVLSGGTSHAEDVVQEALLRAWKRMSQVKNPASFRSWLFRIARNLLVDQQREGKRIRTEQSPIEAAAHGVGPLERLIEDEGSVRLAAALQRLPSQYREAYLLWTQEGWSYAQISEVVAASEETARWRVCVARQLLAKAMEDYLES